MGPKKQFWPIRMKLSKPFRGQLTQYAEKFFNELLSNISLITCPTPIGITKIRALTSCVISLAQHTHVKFQNNQHKTIGGVVHTRYPLSTLIVIMPDFI